MRRSPFVAALLVALVPLFVACDDDEDSTGPTPEFDLTFSGDASFQGAHGGQTIHVAVVRAGSGEIVAEQTGTVSASADPAFEFTFASVLADGESYDLDYWIDSNFGGGSVGTCDPPETDHQWRMSVGPVSGDVTLTDSHRPTETQSVCATFSAATNPGSGGTGSGY